MHTKALSKRKHTPDLIMNENYTENTARAESAKIHDFHLRLNEDRLFTSNIKWIIQNVYEEIIWTTCLSTYGDCAKMAARNC